MARRHEPPPLLPEELRRAVVQVSQRLSKAQTNFSISGGAASALIRWQHGLEPRATDDIDLVVQPTDSLTAESVSEWLLQDFPDEFIAKSLYGVSIPALAFRRPDGSVKNVEIEIFDIKAWPQRPQYDLENPDNDIVKITVFGHDVPVFSPRWLLREKIVTAYERQGSRKEETDLDDACELLSIVGMACLNLTRQKEAVKHFHTQRPGHRQLLELKIVCPDILGPPWVWNEAAGMFWRAENDKLSYLDADLDRHEFKWDREHEVWYFSVDAGSWAYSSEKQDIVRRL